MSELPPVARKLQLVRFGERFRDCVRIVETALTPPVGREVVVRIDWAGVNGVFDSQLANNALGYARTYEPPLDLGVEAVGTVAACGPGVAGLSPGDAVSVVQVGCGYHDYLKIEEAALRPIRSSTPDILALLPTGISALLALEVGGDLASGEVVAITAAAGGLGHIAVQLAKAQGNHVVALCSGARKGAMVAELGADLVLDSRADDLDQVFSQAYPDGIDLALDTVGGRLFDLLVDHLANKGRLVIAGYAAEQGANRPQIVMQERIYTRLYWKAASLRAFQNGLYRELHDDAARRLLARYYDGTLRVLVDPQPFVGLEEIPDAVEHLMAGENLGKVVVRLGG